MEDNLISRARDTAALARRNEERDPGHGEHARSLTGKHEAQLAVAMLEDQGYYADCYRGDDDYWYVYLL